MSIEIGAEGKVIAGVRCGLPDHIDGVPVPWGVPVLTLPRWYSRVGKPLPMIELREDGDGGNSMPARWPEPFPHQTSTSQMTRKPPMFRALTFYRLLAIAVVLLMATACAVGPAQQRAPESLISVTDARAARDAAILALLRKGIDVMCDDTNLPARTIRDLAKLAAGVGADFEVLDFTDVAPGLCIARDRARDHTVGEDVIRDMHRRFLEGRPIPLPLPGDMPHRQVTPEPYKPLTDAEDVVLVDIDGTAALRNGRDPYDETRVSEDLPNVPVLRVVSAMHAAGNGIVFMSGRSEGCREDTEAWLAMHGGVPYLGLYMRASGDRRRDAIVKAELFDRHVRTRYNVVCVIDDRRQVVEMWRAMGLTVMQVADGDF